MVRHHVGAPAAAHDRGGACAHRDVLGKFLQAVNLLRNLDPVANAAKLVWADTYRTRFHPGVDIADGVDDEKLINNEYHALVIKPLYDQARQGELPCAGS